MIGVATEQPHVLNASDGYISVDGARIHYRAVGAGRPLVVLHGGPDFDHRYLLPELDRLAGTVRLIYYDQRGRGWSSAGVAAEDITVQSEIADLDRLRRHFDFEAIDLLGHSWGCILAMEYAARCSESTRSVVLMNPAPASHEDLQRFRDAREASEAETLSRMRAIAQTPAYLAGDIAAEAEYYLLHYQRAVHRPEYIPAIVARLRVAVSPPEILKARAIEQRLYEQTWLRPEYDLLERFARFTGPTLVLHGAQDFVPAACAARIAAASPRSRMVVLGGCGHFAYLETPEQVQREIERFLARGKNDEVAAC